MGWGRYILDTDLQSRSFRESCSLVARKTAKSCRFGLSICFVDETHQQPVQELFYLRALALSCRETAKTKYTSDSK
jgi:hypothetical protein